MVRIRHITWVTALLVFVATLLLRVGISLNDPGHGVFGAVLLGLSFVFITALLTLFVALLVAIPKDRSGNPYGRRMWLRLPFVMLGTVAFMCVAVYFPEWWEGKHRMASFEGRPYDEVITAGEGDCASVKEGAFWNEGIHIERRGMRQFQRDKLLGMEEEIEVSWPTPCEYILHGEDSLSTRYVKIVGVDDKGYDCLVYSSPKGSTGYTIRLERVR